MGQSFPPRHVVLVVEDHALLRMMAINLMKASGFDVVEAENADVALEILTTRTDIRIVFTDVDMPGSIDGLKLAAIIRDRWPPIKILIVSGHPRPEESDMPLRSAFFGKPYDETAVVATLRGFVA